MSTRTHTHKGHCQLCDRLQAVDNGRGTVAKHGYTKRWGFFQGTCPGSGHRPYEVSSDQLPHAITVQEARIADLTTRVADLQTFGREHPTQGAVTLYSQRRNFGDSRRTEQTVMGTFSVEKTEAHTWGDMVYICWTPDKPVVFKDEAPITQLDSTALYRSNQFYSTERTPEAYATAWCTRAIASVEATRKQHETYVARLIARYTTWAPRVLVSNQ